MKVRGCEPWDSGPSSEGKWIPSLLSLLTLGTRSVSVMGRPVHCGMLSNTRDPPDAGGRPPTHSGDWKMSPVLSRVQLFPIPWTVAHQVPLSLGILQARTLEWVAMSSSRESSRPRDWTCASHVAGGFFTHEVTGEAPSLVRTASHSLSYCRLCWSVSCLPPPLLQVLRKSGTLTYRAPEQGQMVRTESPRLKVRRWEWKAPRLKVRLWEWKAPGSSGSLSSHFYTNYSSSQDSNAGGGGGGVPWIPLWTSGPLSTLKDLVPEVGWRLSLGMAIHQLNGT